VTGTKVEALAYKVHVAIGHSNVPMKVFEKLKADDCRWPFAEFDRGEFLFCDDAIAERYIAPGVPCPYCVCHLTTAYKPSAGRTIAKLEAAEGRRQEFIAIAAAA
jgi:hypothetical protein